MCGRNDAHGGRSFKAKITEILRWNAARFDAVGLDYDFCFVEWGMEQGRPWLSPELVKRFPRLRAIMVPDDTVAAAQVPPVRFQEFTAKNIGIAHAGDGLIVATNSDILFSTDLVKYLKELTPDDNVLYRAPRHDFSCSGRLPEQESDFVWVQKYGVGAWFNEAAGDFTAATRGGWAKIGGYCESGSHVRHLDSELVSRAVAVGLKPVETPPVFHKEHPESTRLAAVWKWEWGVYDPRFDDGSLVFDRRHVWGHRGHILTVEENNLFMLRPDCWESEVRYRTDFSGQKIYALRKGGIRCKKTRR